MIPPVVGVPGYYGGLTGLSAAAQEVRLRLLSPSSVASGPDRSAGGVGPASIMTQISGSPRRVITWLGPSVSLPALGGEFIDGPAEVLRGLSGEFEVGEVGTLYCWGS